jgi:hypothetical protein
MAVRKKGREPILWPFAEIGLEAPAPWGGAGVVPLVWDGKARAVTSICGPVARSAPIRLTIAGQPAGQTSAAIKWLQQHGYTNVAVCERRTLSSGGGGGQAS